MTQNTPNWDSISESIGFIKATVNGFVDEFKEDLTDAAFPDKVEDAEVGEVILDPFAEAMRVLKDAESVEFIEQADARLRIADRYIRLAGL